MLHTMILLNGTIAICARIPSIRLLCYRTCWLWLATYRDKACVTWAAGRDGLRASLPGVGRVLLASIWPRICWRLRDNMKSKSRCISNTCMVMRRLLLNWPILALTDVYV